MNAIYILNQIFELDNKASVVKNNDYITLSCLGESYRIYCLLNEEQLLNAYAVFKGKEYHNNGWFKREEKQ